MEPKRLRFSDFSSDSSSGVQSPLSPRSTFSPPSDMVLRLSASFTTISTASTESTEKRGSVDLDTERVLNSCASGDKGNPPRHSTATIASGTTVWTAQGSARTTIGGRTIGTVSSTENTENLGEAARKLRRMTVGTVSSNRDNSFERAPTPTEPRSSQPISLSQRTTAIADDTEELPPTQPRGPLKDIIAYVEVHSGTDNRSAVIGNVLRDLGATVAQRFTNKVTHVVFREGRQSTVERARSRNVYLVSVLWVDTCLRTKERPCETDFPIVHRLSKTPQTVARSRRPRSMQPKPMEVELALTDEVVRKRKQRLEATRLRKEIIKELRSGITYKPPTTTAENESPPSLLSSNATVNISDEDGQDVASSQNMDTDRGEGREMDSFLDDAENLADSVRKKLFESGGLLQGTPVPSFLNRRRKLNGRGKAPKVAVISKAQNEDSNRKLRDLNLSDDDNGNVPDLGVRKSHPAIISKIDDVIASVCEKVSQMNIATNGPSQRRRIFDSGSQVRIDEIDLTGSDDGLMSLTARVASNSAAVDVREIFGHDLNADNGKKRKNGRGTKADDSVVRLRSSLFNMKSSFGIIQQQLQAGRRSSEDFIDICEKLKSRKESAKKGPASRKDIALRSPPALKRRPKSSIRRSTRTLVMTNVKEDDRELIYAIVKRLKNFHIEKNVTTDTTHVICGGNRRTLNVLSAIARGCWILPVEWVYHSLANGSWLDEAQFELGDQFPAAQVVRKRKPQVVTSLRCYDCTTTCELFNGVGTFYVGPLSQPPPQELRTLIRWCGGKIVLTSRRASHCIGCAATHDDAVGLKETWILDSIMAQDLLPLGPYILH